MGIDEGEDVNREEGAIQAEERKGRKKKGKWETGSRGDEESFEKKAADGSGRLVAVAGHGPYR